MAAAAERTKKSNGRLAIVVAVLLFAAAGAAAVYMATRQPAETGKLPAPAEYVALSPQFVVNLGDSPGGPRYLQVEVQLVTRDPAATLLLQHHAPALRARLLMLFAQQTYDGLASREGKEALQAAALEEVQALMATETGGPQADALLFTSFVTQ